MNFGRIEKQGFASLKVPNKLLAGKSDAARFNGALVEYKGQILLAYRCYSTKHGRSCIGLTRFTHKSFMAAMKSGDPNKLKTDLTLELNLYAKCKNNSILEDPRFMIHNGALYISYVELLIGKGWHPSIRLCKLDDDFNVEHVVPMHLGENETGIEKNWIFFSHEGKIHVIYDTHTHHIFQVNEKSGKSENVYGSDYIHWIWGWMRGGTTPVRLNKDEYLTFMHSSDYKAWSGRRYSMTPYCFSAKPPFQITRLWDKPIVFGSHEEHFCGGGNGSCIFPMGIIEHGDEYWVSAGVNDSFSAIIKFNKEEILKKMKPAEDFYEARWFHFFTNSGLTSPAPGKCWTILKSGGNSGTQGIFHTDDIKVVAELIYNSSIQIITHDKFHELHSKWKKKQRIIA